MVTVAGGLLGLVAALLAVAVVAVAVAPAWTFTVCLVVGCCYLGLNHGRFIYIILRTLPRDLTGGWRYGRLLLKTSRWRRQDASVASVFSDRAQRLPNNTCFLFEDQVWTNRDVDEYSNKIANIFQEAGFQFGDSVALCMDNRPEFVCVWLGLAKLGVVTALINTNLRQHQLLHTLNVATVQAIIYSKSTAPAIHDVLDNLKPSTKLYHLGPLHREALVTRILISLDPLLENASTSAPKIEKLPGYSDKLLYIYTSGTTGLPKAAVLPNSRFFFASFGVITLLNLRHDDVIYNPLPLYHTAGGVLGVGAALIRGIPVVIVKKFSATAYWKDCIKYQCTVSQYIGEICRYLLARPPAAEDHQHKVRVMMGNGLRLAISKRFVERFNLAYVSEFYGSTEGNANLGNFDRTVGAVGFIPRLAPRSLTGVGLIRFNNETGEPIRDKSGMCINCDIGEAGMFVGIINSDNATRQFHGYADKTSTEKKVIRDVFKRGDRAFVSGDLLEMDECGYFYYKDRTGDTFRWKSENVSTAEVEATIITIIGLREAAVYGVEIPGCEGRVGMVAIVDIDDSLDLAGLASGLDLMLASYARPLFLRVVAHMDLTGTFKMKKVDLQRDGFNPSAIKDKLYFLEGKTYVPLTPDLYQSIVSGATRL